MTLDERIEAFLAAGPYAVAGASTDRDKYGNKVLRCYVQNGRTPVYPLNPRAAKVEGLRAYPDLAAASRASSTSGCSRAPRAPRR